MSNAIEDDLSEAIKLLKQALRNAIKEVREHNNEYHHVTKEEMIKRWEKLL